MRAAAALTAAALLLAPLARADDGELPPKHQAVLLLRVLAYDRALPERAGEAVRIAVAYRPDDADSRDERTRLVEALQATATGFVVWGRPVSVVAIPWRGTADDLVSRLVEERAAVVHVGTALAGEVPAIARAARRASIRTTTGNRAMVLDGLGVGLVLRGERAAVLVNLAATRAEGALLDSALLSLAEKVIGGETEARSRAPGP